MKAAVFHGVGKQVVIETVPDPVPGPDEVVIKVGSCGICGTDVHMTADHNFAPPPGSALGHEYSGEVVELGSGVDQLNIGDKIAVLPMAGCGTCAHCLAGHPYACPQVRMFSGGFGEYALASATFATKLPAGLTLADGALIEPLAAALRGVTMSKLTRESKILIIGAGTMGLAAAYWARRLGAGKIVVTARSHWREAMAIQMGADKFLASDDALAQNVNSALDGPPDIVFEAAGAPGMIAHAVNLVRPRGTVLAVGGCMQPDMFNPFIAMYKELRMQFSAAYTAKDFQIAVDAFDGGAIEPRSLITATLPLSSMPAMLETLREGNRQCKVMIDPWMA